jgi:hypothetical protein
MRFAIVMGSLVLSACAAHPKGAFTSIPEDTPAECTRICGGMGMQMTAVVIAASRVGCVCEKGPGAARASGNVAAATSAIVTSDEESPATQQQPANQSHR